MKQIFLLLALITVPAMSLASTCPTAEMVENLRIAQERGLTVMPDTELDWSTMKCPVKKSDWDRATRVGGFYCRKGNMILFRPEVDEAEKIIYHEAVHALQDQEIIKSRTTHAHPYDVMAELLTEIETKKISASELSGLVDIALTYLWSEIQAYNQVNVHCNPKLKTNTDNKLKTHIYRHYGVGFGKLKISVLNFERAYELAKPAKSLKEFKNSREYVILRDTILNNNDELISAWSFF